MDLHTKLSKPLLISLLVLAVIIIFSIGTSIGASFNRHHTYINNMRCSDYHKFERGHRGQKYDGRKFRMMVPQGFNAKKEGRTQDVQSQFPDNTTQPLSQVKSFNSKATN